VRFILNTVDETTTAPSPAEANVARGPVATTRAAAAAAAAADPQAAEAASLALAEGRASGAGAALRIGLTRLSTEHAVIYTDCEPNDRAGVESAVERDLSAVDRELRSLHLEPWTRGRLPVFVFSRMSEMNRLHHDVESRPELPDGAWGYYFPAPAGMGYVVTYRPPRAADRNATRKGEADWNYTLTHEFTHALVARYHPGRELPNWADEGLAEYVACAVSPQKNPINLWAQYRMGGQGNGVLLDIVNGRRPMRGLDDYHVYHTMIATLHAIRPDAFPRLIGDLKDGVDVAASLRARYGLRLLDLSQKWADRVAELAKKGQ
jgi:hypothetical protein